MKTSSGRLRVRFRIVDTTTNGVRDLGLVRSQPGALRAAFRNVVTALLETARRTQSEPTDIAWPPLPPPEAMPPIPEPPADEPPPTPPWYQTIGVNAFVSARFTYNFNRPPSGTKLRVFDEPRRAHDRCRRARRAARCRESERCRLPRRSRRRLRDPARGGIGRLVSHDIGKAQDFDL